MNKGLMVTKRDGTLEQINLDKIHRVITKRLLKQQQT